MGDKTKVEDFEALATEAKLCLDTGGFPDSLVLIAIERGCDTRAKIKSALQHFGYDVIEKALERQAGEIRMHSSGPIDRLTLASQNGNHKVEEDPEHKIARMIQEGQKPPNVARETSVALSKPAHDWRRGPTYKELDLAEVERVMATEETIESAARKLGMSSAQLYTRRGKDKAVDEAVERGRETYYKLAPEIELDTEEEQVEPVDYIEPEPQTGAFSAGLPEPSAPVVKISAVRPEEIITEVAAVAPEFPFANLPSAVIKEMRWDDAFFANAYDTLIGILDDDMDGDEKQAIWTIILYLKSVERETYSGEKSD